jgi:hypothetical protein
MNTRSPFFCSLSASLVFLQPVLLAEQAPSAPPKEDEISAIDTLRADIHADHLATIRSQMQLNPDESVAFWPIYKEYSAEMSRANDDRIAAIREYADSYAILSNADASALTLKILNFEQHRLDVKKKYFKEFSSKLSGKTVAKFFQLEHRFDLVVDLEIASHLPAVLDKPLNP